LESEVEQLENDAMDVVGSDAGLKFKKKTDLSSKVKAKTGKDIYFSLPPLFRIGAVFADMTTKVDSIGFGEVLKELNGCDLDINTMCCEAQIQRREAELSRFEDHLAIQRLALQKSNKIGA
jgi:hypothetical protein